MATNDNKAKEKNIKKVNVKVTEHPKSNNLLSFISKMQQFENTPPSDNLWSISIQQEESDVAKLANLESLFKMITSVNKSWKDYIGTKWAIDTTQVENNEKRESEYIKQFDEEGIFLAQNISFTPMANNISDNPWTIGSSEHAGFLNFGMLSLGRQDTKSLKVSFLISNWDICDLLFDRWISAVAQHGLLESGESSIKARITITEYSAGVAENYRKEKDKDKIGMRQRKQYIFYNCIPVSRGEVSKNYEQTDAGVFKKSIVDFRYEDYKIQYLL